VLECVGSCRWLANTISTKPRSPLAMIAALSFSNTA
jgi:hypothetical protein